MLPYVFHRVLLQLEPVVHTLRIEGRKLLIDVRD